MKKLSYRDICHLGCVDCKQFIPSSFYFENAEEGECRGTPLEFCRRYFDARL